MSLNETAAAAVTKKVALLDASFSRFAVRSILAGVYLAIGTAFAAVLGQAVEVHAAGLGAPVFALFFGLGLFAIIILGAELATGNMMYMVYGAVTRQVGWSKGLWLGRTPGGALGAASGCLQSLGPGIRAGTPGGGGSVLPRASACCPHQHQPGRGLTRPQGHRAH